jgi:RNA polymerase sigma-70 factor (ECF subfamily)
MAWMMGILRNRALDVLRRRREAAIEDVAGHDDWPDDTPNPLDAALEGSRLRALMACLQELEPKQRESILMAFYEGYTHEEMAQRLGSPVGTIKSWVRRGLIKLRACLDR